MEHCLHVINEMAWITSMHWHTYKYSFYSYCNKTIDIIKNIYKLEIYCFMSYEFDISFFYIFQSSSSIGKSLWCILYSTLIRVSQRVVFMLISSPAAEENYHMKYVAKEEIISFKVNLGREHNNFCRQSCLIPTS